MPDYNRTIIYKLCCNGPAVVDVYICACCNFASAKYRHESQSQNDKHQNYKSPLYLFIREHGGFESWNMIQIEAFSCVDKREKDARQRHWIELLNPSLNTTMNYDEDHKKWTKMWTEGDN